jgi:hypothetical protein
MDEASKLLEDIIISKTQLPTAYHKLSPNPPLVAKVVDMIPSLVDPTLPLKSEVKVVDLVPSSFDPTLPLKSEIQVVDPSPLLVDPSLPLESDIRQVINLIPLSRYTVKLIPLTFFLLIPIIMYKGAFLLLLLNPIQVMSPFFVIGMG